MSVDSVKIDYTAQECIDALDILSSAVRYLRLQYSGGMARPIAKAHFEARAILINASSALLDESEAIFKHHAEAIHV